MSRYVYVSVVCICVVISEMSPQVIRHWLTYQIIKRFDTNLTNQDNPKIKDNLKK